MLSPPSSPYSLDADGVLHHVPPSPPPCMQLLLSIYYSGMAAACFMALNWMLGAYCIVMGLLFMVLSFGDYFF